MDAHLGPDDAENGFDRHRLAYHRTKSVPSLLHLMCASTDVGLPFAGDEEAVATTYGDVTGRMVLGVDDVHTRRPDNEVVEVPSFGPVANGVNASPLRSQSREP